MTAAAALDLDSPVHAAPILAADHLAAGYDRRPVIEAISCALAPGELVGVVGPNGCGKSTLLKTLSGHLTPIAGSVTLHGQPLTAMPRSHRARLLATLPQHPDAPPGMTVRDLVHCGRAPHNRWFAAYGPTDHIAIDHAIRSCSLQPLVDRPLTELSGGERQRAWIAMTLAQQARILLLDEPTSALDIGHQLDVMKLLRFLTTQRGLAVAVVMHDLNLAIRYCDRLMVMDAGRLVGQCRPLRSQDWTLLERVFQIAIDSNPDPGATLSFRRMAGETSPSFPE